MKIKFFGARLLLSNRKKTQEILPSCFCLVLSQKCQPLASRGLGLPESILAY